MSTEEPRNRPKKLFRVLIAYGPYRKGDKIQPTGTYRSALLHRRVIEEVIEAPLEVAPITPAEVPPATETLRLPRKSRGPHGSK